MKKLLLLLWLATFSVSAQQITFSGKVINENQEILVGAEIYIPSINKGTITNINGNFSFDIPKGNYQIKFSHIGYKTKIITYNLAKNTTIVVNLSALTEQLDQVIISAVKATNDMPVTQTNISKKKLTEKNLAQDVPYLLNQTPSVVVTSDAGAGVGYTGIRIRGISPQQINVTLNGIPLNDPESHGVYWVDIPDFASSTQSLQVQRGVGTSTFGTGAFGASINLATDNIRKNAYANIQTTYGSFNTKKYSVKSSTGILNNHFEFTGRFSKISSDGYIDRAKSDLKSYYISGTYKDEKSQLKAIIFGGSEITYQAWYGVDKDKFDNNPTYNYAGALWNDTWEVIGFYDNEVDNYKQDHYQLHYNRKISDNLSFNLATHYTYGRGYYEQYKQDRDFADYGFTPITINGQTIDKTDLIRRKWLDNDFYGMVGSLKYKADNMKIIIGLSANEYDGRHFGKVIWAQFASDSKINHEYYNNLGIKKAVNGFAKTIYKLNDQMKLFADIQFRKIDYSVNGTVDWQYNWETKDNLFFVNPKLGLFYQMNNKNDLYISLAQTHREPNRDDYENAGSDKPKPEMLNNIETGWKHRSNNFNIETNIYGMFYKDQLVLSGKIDNVGNPIRENVGKSYRMGLETQAGYAFSKNMEIATNITISKNKNVDYYAKENGNLINYGNTQLTYSPNIVAGVNFTYKPIEQIKLELTGKYIGEQYMNNQNTDNSKLDAYSIFNSFISYRINPKQYIKTMQFSLQVNNLFNKNYASNGYMWGDTAYYFPQAGTNFLLGVSLDF